MANHLSLSLSLQGLIMNKSSFSDDGLISATYSVIAVRYARLLVSYCGFSA